MKFGKILAVLIALALVGVIGVTAVVMHVSSTLPKMIKVEDYQPLLVTEVYARGGEKIGEYSRENRTIVPYNKVPQRLIKAFLAAEDDKFFEHGGVNYLAIMRAFAINLLSGEKRQGASTITQQVARALLLSSEKTYTRKIKEILLAHKMEDNLSKEDILYLYLNQIYFGEGAYGVVAAADTYFRKPIEKLTLPEMAILAGLPQAPSSYSPTTAPEKAKARQRYVLERMATVGFITREEQKRAVEEPVTVFLGKEYKQIAPYYVETLRQLLVQQFGEKAVLDEGLRVYTSLDFKAQQEATKDVVENLRVLDKRQGWRGAQKNITSPDEQRTFLVAERKKLKSEKAPIRIILPDGKVVKDDNTINIFHKRDAAGHIVSNLPDYVRIGEIVDGLVTAVDDKTGLSTVRFAEGQGLIDIADMGWARKPDASINALWAPKISRPSTALKIGDVVRVKILADRFHSERLGKHIADLRKKAPSAGAGEYVPDGEDYAQLALEQEPLVEGALLSFDQKTGDVIAMVGGKEFIRNKNEFNRTLQAKRQTGSSFKTIVYASALDRGFNPATPIQDAPIVYETKNDKDVKEGKDAKELDEGETEGQEDVKTWKPHNHGQRFVGDILFRTALIRSLNIPAVKVLESVGVPWAIDYARRLGVFSPLNADLSLVLGSSSLTLYEMTKVFSNFGRLGQRVRPTLVQKVLDRNGKVMLENLSLDKRFEKEISEIDAQFEERRKTELTAMKESRLQPTPAPAPGQPPPKPKIPNIFFDNPDQLISPQTAYIMTTILNGVINEEGGTGGAARALGRPAAGKTGSSNNYVDGWFLGYTPQIVTGVWVGFDEEKTMGPGEVGGRSALPIWVDYMKAVHQGLPVLDFSVPPGITFANIDATSGQLASSSSSRVVRQAFVEGTEPTGTSAAPTRDDETDFLKKDLTE